jgi:hypothetical protein
MGDSASRCAHLPPTALGPGGEPSLAVTHVGCDPTHGHAETSVPGAASVILPIIEATH